MNKTTLIMSIAVVTAFVMGTLIAGNVAEAGNPVKKLATYANQLDSISGKLTGTVDEIGTGPFTNEQATALLFELGKIELAADEIRDKALVARNIIIISD